MKWTQTGMSSPFGSTAAGLKTTEAPNNEPDNHNAKQKMEKTKGHFVPVCFAIYNVSNSVAIVKPS